MPKQLVDRQIKKMLAKRFGEKLRENEPMSAHTTFRVGGPADLFVMPENMDDLLFLVRLVSLENIPWFVLGAGSNLLVRDGGFRGVVISMHKFSGISETPAGNGKVIVSAGAGLNLPALCRYAKERGLSGMAFAVGIPGSVGGALCMNAGTAQGDMESVISSVTVLWPDGRIEQKEKKDMIFTYRSMKVKRDAEMEVKGCGSGNTDMAPIFLKGHFHLSEGSRHEISLAYEKALEKRRFNQPAGLSAGSFFKNPQPGVSAGSLIEKAGLKGVFIGGACVSERHANFIINTGCARAADIIALAELVQRTVKEKFNETLIPEVVIIGED